jgi:hypothetical protein
MKTKLALMAGAVILTCVLCSGCVVALGNRGPEQERKATLGKQLTDLKQARDTGVINEEEYQTAKKRLIEGK